MHILLGILALLGIAVAVWFKFRATTAAARGALDLAEDVAAAFRRYGSQAKSTGNPLDSVDDPKVAGAGILAAIAAMDGDLRRPQIDALQAECRRMFGSTDTEATDLVAIGRWLVQQRGPDEAIRKLSRQLRSRLDPAEAAHLLAAAETVAAIEGGSATEQQRLAMAQIRKDLG